MTDKPKSKPVKEPGKPLYTREGGRKVAKQPEGAKDANTSKNSSS